MTMLCLEKIEWTRLDANPTLYTLCRIEYRNPIFYDDGVLLTIFNTGTAPWYRVLQFLKAESVLLFQFR